MLGAFDLHDPLVRRRLKHAVFGAAGRVVNGSPECFRPKTRRGVHITGMTIDHQRATGENSALRCSSCAFRAFKTSAILGAQ
jgi:hypothetical protein